MIVESPSDRGNISGRVLSGSGAPLEKYELRVAEVDAPGEDGPVVIAELVVEPALFGAEVAECRVE